MDQQVLTSIEGKVGDIADNIYTGLNDFNMHVDASLGTTNMLLGIISISLIAMVVLKFLELKKSK